MVFSGENFGIQILNKNHSSNSGSGGIVPGFTNDQAEDLANKEIEGGTTYTDPPEGTTFTKTGIPLKPASEEQKNRRDAYESEKYRLLHSAENL